MKEKMKERREKPTFDEFVASTAARIEAWPDWKRVSVVPAPAQLEGHGLRFPDRASDLHRRFVGAKT